MEKVHLIFINGNNDQIPKKKRVEDDYFTIQSKFNENEDLTGVFTYSKTVESKIEAFDDLNKGWNYLSTVLIEYQRSNAGPTVLVFI